MIIFFALTLFAMFYNLKKKQPTEEVDLSKNNSLFLKAVCAICVIFHHIGQKFGYLGVMKNFNTSLGGVAVGIFFFLSAYGLVLQYKKRGNAYLKKLLFVNIPKLYGIFVGVNVIYYFAFFNNSAQTGGFGSAILQILGFDWGNRPCTYSWFIYTIFVMYLAFVVVYFLCSFSKNKNLAPIIMSVLPVLFLIVFNIYCKVTGANMIIYIRRVEFFSIGILYGTFKSKIDQFLLKWQRWILLFSVLLYAVFLKWYVEEALTLIACVCSLILCNNFTFSNKVMLFIGKISLWIYLLQGIFVRIFENYVGQQMLYAFAVISCTFASATVVYFCEKGIYAVLRRIKIKKC